ncbi:TPA: hypothetical protein DD394_09895 [bacterium UBP9_UBA11836]|nr:hypothetical protein [bacterium UBP9_UBA11836]
MAGTKKRYYKGKMPLPKIIGLSIVVLALLSFCLTLAMASWHRRAQSPALEKNYNQFVKEVKSGNIASVEMYRDVLYVKSKEEAYFVRSVSDNYTIDLLLKYKVPLAGIEQPSGSYSGRAQIAYIIALLIPYFILGAIVFVMVRAVSGAAKVEETDDDTSSEKK